MSDVFGVTLDFVTKFVRTEIILFSIISGFLIYFLLFHNTKTKKGFREIETGFIVFVIGFITYFIWIPIISPLLIITEVFFHQPLDYAQYLYILIAILGFMILFALQNKNFWKKQTAINRLKGIPFLEVLLFYILFFVLWVILYVATFSQEYYRHIAINYWHVPILSLIVFSLTLYFLHGITSTRGIKISKKKIQRFRTKRFILMVSIFVIFLIVLFGFFTFPSIELGKPRLFSIYIHGNGLDSSYLSGDESLIQNITITPRIVNWLEIPINGTEVSEHCQFCKDIFVDENIVKLNLTFFGNITRFPVSYKKDLWTRRGVDEYEDYFKMDNEYFGINITTFETQKGIWNISISVENKQSDQFNLRIEFREIDGKCERKYPETDRLDSRGYVIIEESGDEKNLKDLEFDLRILEHEKKTYEVLLNCT